jgi:uncharacterized membrane protein YkvA (DUF1232 family)
MGEINEKCLEIFPEWLRSLGDDVQTILDGINSEELAEDPSRFLCGGINYLFKSLDLIPDGIDDIGYLDDAFVLRVAAKAALECDTSGINDETLGKLKQLSEDAGLIEEFLEAEIYARFDKYSRNLRNGAARGRMVDEIIETPAVLKEFIAETKSFISEFSAPAFSKDEKNLIKLKAFFEAKLPK